MAEQTYEYLHKAYQNGLTDTVAAANGLVGESHSKTAEHILRRMASELDAAAEAHGKQMVREALQRLKANGCEGHNENHIDAELAALDDQKETVCPWCGGTGLRTFEQNERSWTRQCPHLNCQANKD